MNSLQDTPDIQPQEVATQQSRRLFSIGLPMSEDLSETIFPLTPEAAGILVERGYRIRLQRGAAHVIHYSDNAYSRVGVEIVEANEALACDVVILMSQPSVAQISAMRRGAMLLTMMNLHELSQPVAQALLKRNILSISLDLITLANGRRPMADAMNEIEGRAALTQAAAILANPVTNKGILLGGVAGTIACEVMIVGSGLAARAAARSAMGLGAIVRMLDSDIYSLREASDGLGGCLITSAMHPRQVESGLHSADVLIVTPTRSGVVFDADAVAGMKRGVLIFDLTHTLGKTFPSLPVVETSVAQPVDPDSLNPQRQCLVRPSRTVGRTASMALSNELLSTLDAMLDCEGVANALKLLPSLQRATLTFMGKPVNKHIAQLCGCRTFDINIALTLS